MSRYLYAACVIAMAGALYAAYRYGAATNHPDLARPDVRMGEHDFGTVPEHSVEHCTFQVPNNSDRTWRVVGSIRRCGCLKFATTSDVIPPGEVLNASVAFNTAGLQGKIVKRGFLIVDPGRRVFACSVRATVFSRPRLTPEVVVLKLPSEETRFSSEVSLSLPADGTTDAPVVEPVNLPTQVEVETGAPSAASLRWVMPVKFRGALGPEEYRRNFVLRFMRNGSDLPVRLSVTVLRKEPILIRPSFLTVRHVVGSSVLEFDIASDEDWLVRDSGSLDFSRIGSRIRVDPATLTVGKIHEVRVATKRGSYDTAQIVVIPENLPIR